MSTHKVYPVLPLPHLIFQLTLYFKHNMPIPVLNIEETAKLNTNMRLSHSIAVIGKSKLLYNLLMYHYYIFY